MIELEPGTAKSAPTIDLPPKNGQRPSSGIGRLLPRTVRGTMILLLFLVIFPGELAEVSHYYSLFNEQRSEENQHNLQLARTIGTTFDTFVQDILLDEVTLGRTLDSWGYDSSEHLN